jgi:hypothetical protein
MTDRATQEEGTGDSLYDEVKNYAKRIRVKDNRFDEFIQWLGSRPEFDFGAGFSKTSISYLLQDIEQLKDGKEGKIKKNIRKAEVFKNAARVYLDHESSSGFSGSIYFVYFFYLVEPETSAMLGRAVLHFIDRYNAKLINVPDSNSKNYEGTYIQVNEVMFLDLENRRKYKLHIKVEVPDGADQDISLGVYSTYEAHRITSGSLILHKIDQAKVPPDARTPELFSYSNLENKEAFDKIDPAIKKYLSLKRMNYHSVPREITNLKSLAKYMDNYSPFSDRPQRFAEIDTPVIYFAIPSVSVNPKVNNADLVSIKKIIDNLQINFKGVCRIQSDSFNPNNTTMKSPSQNLKDLAGVSIFILFVTKIDAASFAFVQLGWAIANCKYSLIFYKEKLPEEDTVSEKMKTLDSLGVERIAYQDLKTQFEEKYYRLEGRIREFLNNIK